VRDRRSEKVGGDRREGGRERRRKISYPNSFLEKCAELFIATIDLTINLIHRL
jgi:hypothetical protein